MNQYKPTTKVLPTALPVALFLAAIVGLATAARAAVTDIASVPLTTSSQTLVKPNVMFILDSSGSMASDYMPDDANFSRSKYGFYAAQCNGLAYNADTTVSYPLPVDSTGATLPAGSFTFPTPADLNNVRDVLTTAPTVGTGSFTLTLSNFRNGDYSIGQVVTLFSSADTSKWMQGTVTAANSTTDVLTVNVTETAGSGTLTSPRIGDGDHRPFFYTYSRAVGGPAPLAYTYDTNGVITSTTFYQECNSSAGSLPARFTKVIVTPTYANLQKYRDWYTYYRTRSLMMRAAASLAFQPIGDRYRVGFSTIRSTSVDGSEFLNIADFGTTQKYDFYTQLQAAPDGYTPLRGALSKAGRYFAKKGTLANGGAQTYDPMQYSCQRNYAILTTDGYWNTGKRNNDGTYEPGSETPTYGPFKLDGSTTVGQQDGGSTPRPMKDGAVTTVQARTSTLQTRTITTQAQTSTSTLRQRSVFVQQQSSTSTLQQRSVSTQWQTAIVHLQRRDGQLQTRTTANGNAGSPTWTAWSNTSSCTWDTSGNNQRQCQYAWTGWSNVASCSKSMSSGTSNGTDWTIGSARDCQYETPVYANTASCTAVAPSPGPTNYTVGTATLCSSIVTNGPWTNAASCNASATNECQYTGWTAYANTASCTAVNQSTGPNYTVGTATRCNSLAPVYGAWTGAASCTASATNECGYTAWSAYANTATCTAVAQSTAPNYTVATAAQCNTVTTNGPWTNALTCTASASTGCQYTGWTAWTNIASCTAAPQSVTPNFTVGTATECQSTTTGGSTDTLADVAMYFYETDLRTVALANCTATVNSNPSDVCANNLSPSGVDSATHQHMTTFTVGMGVNGTLGYQSNYLTALTGDYHDITQGTKDWPNATPSTEPENIDDLWHAAVNGRGRYFSAGDPQMLADSLSQTLASIDAKRGAGSAAAASTLQPIAGDNTLFIAKFKSQVWLGDIDARDIDPRTGAIAAPKWSAAKRLQGMVDAGTPRNIFYFKRNASANTGALRAFTYANLSTDGLAGLFSGACSKSPALTQCSTSGFDTTTANLGSNMVSYLRGLSSPVYRTRITADTDIQGGILGDVIGGAPVYVRSPSFKYTENDYAGFITTINATNSGAGRPGVVYVAANDGMLHAFDGATGDEKWAYVPTMVMDRMYRLADDDYANRHEFFVNGAPVVGDIFVPGSPGAWRTILVGGLGAGGRGYYALDITDPNNPTALWEFGNDTLGGNDNLGLTFGNPVITKRADGKWVVVFSSGYNNVSPGDGNGHLFVVDAKTGARVEKSLGVPLEIPTYTSGTTPAGTTTTPSGLGKINAWVDSVIDNTAKRFYGGDLLGNLWRFDIDNLVAPNQAALRLANMSISGVPQAITTQPKLAEVNYAGSPYPVVYVGTGKYLGSTDLGNTQTQSVYALKDPMTNTPLGDVHASSAVIAQTITQAVANGPFTTSSLAVDWSTQYGWRVDLLGAGERVNVDMLLLNRSLIFSGNTPSTDVCFAGGSSNLFELDIGTGSGSGAWLGGTMMVGLSWLTLESSSGVRGGGRSIWIGVGAGGGDPLTGFIKDPDSGPPKGRRTSWRELVN